MFQLVGMICVLCMALVVVPGEAHAYIGPGAGLSAIGSFLALVAAVVAAIFGFLWYPIKRMIRNRKAGAGNGEEK